MAAAFFLALVSRGVAVSLVSTADSTVFCFVLDAASASGLPPEGVFCTAEVTDAGRGGGVGFVSAISGDLVWLERCIRLGFWFAADVLP